MIIGRKDRQRVERMKKTIAAQEEELRQKVIANTSYRIRAYEEDIERMNEAIRKQNERISELKGELEKRREAGSNDYPDAVGRIDYMFLSGEIGESKTFYDAEKLICEAEKCNNYGIPVEVVVYADENGPRAPMSRFDFIDCSTFQLRVRDEM